METLTVVELAVIVGDALGQVDITLLAVALTVEESGSENRDLAVALNREVHVLSGAGEVLTIPDKVASVNVSAITH